MIALDPMAAARGAVASRPERPATALVLDTPDLRLLVFRLQPGQEVPLHRSPSTVTLSVMAGTGTLSSDHESRVCGAGEVVSYEPNELHGMRADCGTELLLLAAITPRPGTRPTPPEA